jgi:DNA-binding NtrC family response regulator
MSQLQGVTVLVVDDEDDLREIFVDEFRAVGALVFEARQASEALEVLRREKIHVVLSDVRMPGGDGLSLMKSIDEEIRPKPLMYLCSGFAGHSDEEMKKIGVLEIFGKPFDWELILAAILKDLKRSN